MRTIANWDALKEAHKFHGHFAYRGPFQDRNQHQVSRRVR